jgi:hypothetical protein
MKVVYRSISREILAAKTAAESMNRTIEYIELTKREMGELKVEMRALSLFPYGDRTYNSVYGVEVREAKP